MKLIFLFTLLLTFSLGMLATALVEEVTLVSASLPTSTPQDRIAQEHVRVYHDKIVIQVADARWASFADTNSMAPLFDHRSHALQVVPSSPEEISVGDIISYISGELIIIHRVVYIDEDQEGWYAIVKGDNNKVADPGKIRFEQIDRVVIGILY
jgi:hypothetical protein